MLGYKDLVKKLGIDFKETPHRIRVLSSLVENGKIEQAKELAKFYNEKDRGDMEEKIVELASVYAENFFKFKDESLAKAEEYLRQIAASHIPSEDYELTGYEVNEDEKGVRLVFSKKKDRRPPKDWWENCIKRAKRFADDPESFCGALYYRPESFPQGEKLKEAFGKPYKGSLTKEEEKILKEAVMSFEGKIKEPLWKRLMFWKKGEKKELTKDYRTQEERGHPDYSTEGKGEGKWEDYRTSKFSEASRKLLAKIKALKKKIEELEEEEKEHPKERLLKKKLLEKEEPAKRLPPKKKLPKEVPIEFEEEEEEIPVKKSLPKRSLPKEEAVERPRFKTKAEREVSKTTLLEKEEKEKKEEKREEEKERPRVKPPERRFEKLYPEIALREESLKRIKEKIARLKERLASLEDKTKTIERIKRKAVFDPRILTDLDPEAGFGPMPEFAQERAPEYKYEVELAHEKSEEIKKPIPKTMQMVKEKAPVVEKAFVEKASKVMKIIDEMIEKGLITENEKYQKFSDLLKFNDFELERFKKFVNETKSERGVLVIDEGIIDFNKIVGD